MSNLSPATPKHPLNIHMEEDLMQDLREFRAVTGMSYNEFFRRIASLAIREWRKDGSIPMQG